MQGGLQRIVASVDMGQNGDSPVSFQQQQQQHQQPLLSRTKLHELIASVSLGERLEPSVEMGLVKLAESFVLEVASASADLARHRRSNAIEPKDILLYLEREYDMGLPGFVDPEEKTIVKNSFPSVGHQTRTAHAIRAAGTNTHNSHPQIQHQGHTHHHRQ